MTTSELGGLLDLYADLSRLEADVVHLVTTLAALADDELLLASDALRQDREAIVALAESLTQLEVETVSARTVVTAAIEDRRRDLPSVAQILDLFRDMIRAEHDVAELDAAVDQASMDPALHELPELAQLSSQLDDLRRRLDRDSGILGQVQQRVGRFLADG